MSGPVIALSVSVALLALVLLMLRIEERRGARFAHSFRVHLDFALLKVRHFVNVRARMWSQYVIRQIAHYLLHTILRGAIGGLDVLKERLKHMLRMNRALARRSDRERSERNKLEELALHKLESALSEEEKRVRKQKSLEG